MNSLQSAIATIISSLPPGPTRDRLIAALINLNRIAADLSACDHSDVERLQRLVDEGAAAIKELDEAFRAAGVNVSIAQA